MNEVIVVETKSNVVSINSYASEPLQTPFQSLLMQFHAPVDKLFGKILGPFDRLLEKVDAGTSVFRSFLNK